MRGVNGTPIDPVTLDTESFVHYTVLDTPVTPLDEPWVEVLDIVCDWADGNTTKTGAIADIVDELFLTDYNALGSARYTGTSGTYNLSLFCSEIENNSTGYGVLCNDTAEGLACFTQALGIHSHVGQFNTDNSSGDSQAVTPLNCSSGQKINKTLYEADIWWVTHQIVSFDHETSPFVEEVADWYIEFDGSSPVQTRFKGDGSYDDYYGQLWSGTVPTLNLTLQRTPY